MPIRVKYCGFTNPDDVIFAAGLGIDKAGFIFAPKSPRHNPIREQTREFLSNLKLEISHIEMVAVIADISLEELLNLLQWDVFSIYQFHWDLDSLEELFEKIMNHPQKESRNLFLLGKNKRKIWLSLSFENLQQFLDKQALWKDLGVTGIVLDSLDKDRYGGTGKTINVTDEKILKLAQLLKLEFVKELFLAGGLTPFNISGILELWTDSWDTAKSLKNISLQGIWGNRMRFPFDGIDLSSGIEKKGEDNKPVKDKNLMQQFYKEIDMFNKRCID